MKESGKHRRLGQKRFTPYLLLLPSILVFAVFTYYPFVRSILLAFSVTDKQGNFVKWVGFSNFMRLLQRSSFWQVISNTVAFALMVCIGTLIPACLLALICIRERKGSRVYQTMYSITMSIASVPASAMFLFILRKDGLLNRFFGTEIAWLQTTQTALSSVAGVTIWLGIGSSFLFLLVGFRNIPEELLESALIDGAGPMRRIIHIIFPIASPQMFFVLFLNITYSFKAFGQIKLLTRGGPAMASETLVYSIYKEAMLNGRFETACAYAIILFLIIFIVTRIQFLLEKKVVFYK
ncbi:MAG: sugar ABC transporter permease [Christensenellaceae bacterium]|nr:sugar ABC transporter permease [Christensenellaceae bacterium]